MITLRGPGRCCSRGLDDPRTVSSIALEGEGKGPPSPSFLPLTAPASFIEFLRSLGGLFFIACLLPPILRSHVRRGWLVRRFTCFCDVGIVLGWRWNASRYSRLAGFSTPLEVSASVEAALSSSDIEARRSSGDRSGTEAMLNLMRT
jgi:hypothetical protein